MPALVMRKFCWALVLNVTLPPTVRVPAPWRRRRESCHRSASPAGHRPGPTECAATVNSNGRSTCNRASRPHQQRAAVDGGFAGVGVRAATVNVPVPVFVRATCPPVPPLSLMMPAKVEETSLLPTVSVETVLEVLLRTCPNTAPDVPDNPLIVELKPARSKMPALVAPPFSTTLPAVLPVGMAVCCQPEAFRRRWWYRWYRCSFLREPASRPFLGQAGAVVDLKDVLECSDLEIEHINGSARDRPARCDCRSGQGSRSRRLE